MKFKPVIWMVLIAAAGLGGWFYFHSGRGTISPNKERADQQGKKTAFNPFHAAPLTEIARVNLSTNILPVLAADAPYEQRAAAVRTVTTKLTSVDFDALYSFLLTKTPADENQNGQVLKNELLDTLCSLSPPPAQLADLLAQIYHDRTQNEVIRDYAVQHLATYFENMSTQSEEVRRARSLEMTESDTVLWEALSETDDSIAGTALLGLERLTQSQPEMDARQVSQAALKLAQDNSAGELTRITALQVCGKMKVEEALPLALETAQQAGSVPLRISAVGALGSLGGSEQITFLQNLIQGADDRLKLPAQHALNQINQRLSLASSGH